MGSLVQNIRENLSLKVSHAKTLGEEKITVKVDDMDLILRGKVPVGGNMYAPEKVNEMLYEVKRQRDVLISAFQKISRWCDGEDQPGHVVYEIERIVAETRSHVLFQEPRPSPPSIVARVGSWRRVSSAWRRSHSSK